MPVALLLLSPFLAMPVLIWVDRRGTISPSQRLVFVGLYIGLVGIVLTRGLAWGHSDGSNVARSQSPG